MINALCIVHKPECKSNICISICDILMPATANGYSHVALSPSFFNNSLWKDAFIWISIKLVITCLYRQDRYEGTKMRGYKGRSCSIICAK